MLEPPGPHDPNRTVMPILLVACPSFRDAWDRHVADWPESEGRGVYIDVGAFAGHLVGLLERGDTSEFPAVFLAVEGLLRDGDDGVRVLLKVGLLEDIGNIVSNSHDWPFAARFRQWFGPETARAWDDLHRLWGTSDSG